MHLVVGRSLSLRALNSVESHRPNLADPLTEWEFEHRRLVHIVPDAADAYIHERLLHIPPPLTYLRSHVIGKDRAIGPDVAVERRSVGPANDHIALQPCPVYPVIGTDLHAASDNRHDPEPLSPPTPHQCH